MTIQYFAQLDENNVVIRVAVVDADFMAENPDRYPGRWVETFVDVPGKIYAGIGLTYDEDSDNFIVPPKPESLTPSAE
jgi:hypothetical protein